MAILILGRHLFIDGTDFIGLRFYIDWFDLEFEVAIKSSWDGWWDFIGWQIQVSESGGLSTDFVRDDGILVLTDLKPLSNQLGSGLCYDADPEPNQI